MENSSVDSKIVKDICMATRKKKTHLSTTKNSKATQQNMDTANRINKSFKDCPEKKERLEYMKYPGIVMIKRQSKKKYLIHSIAQ